MDPAKVLQTVRMLGGGCEDIVVLGCEPHDFGFENCDEGRLGLSGAVSAAVEQAVELAVKLVMARMERLSARAA
jgi:hydrogenase maturation protease